MTLLLGTAFASDPQQEKDPKGMRPPAWYTEPALRAKWNQFTGRYIFQRTCTSCHHWGPDHFSRAGWRAYLAHFPAEHQPPVADRYADLTAMFRPVRYVPDAQERNDTLTAFLLTEAPVETPDATRQVAAYESLPAIGEMAPDFEIDDIEGHHHRVSAYRGKKQLVLVFSRAYW